MDESRDPARDELPVAARDALAHALVAALAGERAGAVLRAMVSVGRLPAGAELPAPADAAGAAARAALRRAGLLGSPDAADAEPGAADAAPGSRGAAPTRDVRLAPPWDAAARERLGAYADVVARARPGTTLGDALAHARLLFARDLEFEVHEVLEPFWRDATGRERRLLQGVIQAAVARYHLRRRNPRGARVLAREAAVKLAGASSPWPDFALDEVASAAERLAAWLESGAAGMAPDGPFRSDAPRDPP